MSKLRNLVSLVIFLMTISANSFASESNPMIKMTTNLGVIEIEALVSEAPNTAQNFIQYVKDGFYNGVIFHRVIPGFVIQGGGFEPGMNQKAPRAPIENEADNGIKNTRGSLSMARTNDPHSATSQFFINLRDNSNLDHSGKNASGWGYAVFAKVVSGMDVVDKIAAVATGTSGHHGDVPTDDVIIERAEVME